MTRRKKTADLGLPSNTVIEVIATFGNNDPWKKEMTVAEWKALKRKKGWTYQAFQKGFSAYPNAKNK